MEPQLTIDPQLLWTPKPTQGKYFDAIRDSVDMGLVAYVGALGSGKTWALCRAAIGLALEYPGIRILLGRFYATDLRDTTMEEYFGLQRQLQEQIDSYFPATTEANLIPKLSNWVPSKNEDHFSNSSLIMFRSLEEGEEKYKSLKIGAFGIDEASEVPVEVVRMLLARIRQPGVKRVGFLVSNPTAKTHWLYKWFVSDPKLGYVLFRTNTYENRDNLPSDYIDRLRANYPEDWVKRYLEGEWGDLTKGKRPVFPNFQTNLHTGLTFWSRKQPVLVGIDFGYATPGVVWAQWEPKASKLDIHKCWSPHEISVENLAMGIKKRTNAWFPNGETRYFAGHDGRTMKDTGVETAEQIFSRLGMRPQIRYYPIERGLQIIRNLMEERENNTSGLCIDPVNETLTSAFSGGYYYPPVRSKSLDPLMENIKEIPFKDGIHDPLMDALRYIVVNNLDLSGDPVLKHFKHYAFRKKESLNAIPKSESVLL